MRLRNSSILISAASFFVLLSSAAQPTRDHDPDAMDSTTTDASAPAPPMTPEQLALIDRYLTNVRAKPVGKIDTARSAAGQGVTLQVTQNATLANGAELPRGTKLTGRILRAQPWEKDGAAAVLSIDIDRAILRDGSAIPIRCVLRTLAPAPGVKTDAPDASQRGGRSRGSSMGPAGGGLSPINDPGLNFPIGGSPGGIGGDSSISGAGSMGGSGSPNGNPSGNPNYPGSATTRNGSIAPGANNPVAIGAGDPGLGGSSTTPLPGQVTAIPAAGPERQVTQAGVDLSDAPRRTGLPGVMLSGASAGASGTLSAFDRNFALDSSTQLTLGIITR